MFIHFLVSLFIVISTYKKLCRVSASCFNGTDKKPPPPALAWAGGRYLGVGPLGALPCSQRSSSWEIYIIIPFIFSLVLPICTLKNHTFNFAAFAFPVTVSCHMYSCDNCTLVSEARPCGCVGCGSFAPTAV